MNFVIAGLKTEFDDYKALRHDIKQSIVKKRKIEVKNKNAT